MNAINQHRDDIQGLRALAVLAVIIFHVNHNWLSGGFVGVDIFFVISGYLITGIVLQQKAQGSFNFFSFYASRLRRIVPAYLFLLASVAAVMAVLLIPRDFDSFYSSLKSAAYFNSNNYFSKQSDYFAPASHELPLLHIWSLAVEMQFYLFLPALLLVVPLRFIKATLGISVGILLFYSCFLLENGEKQSAYFSLLARMPEFLIGSFLASARKAAGTNAHRNIKSWIGLALISLSFLLISEETPFPGLPALAPCIGTALLISTPGSVVNRWLAGRAIVFIGAISYSLYLWHWPILAGFRYYFEAYELPLIILIAFAIITIGLSLVSYFVVESSLRNAKGRKGAYKLAAFSAVAALSVFVARAVNPIVVHPLPVELTRYATPTEICHGQIVGECLRGDLQSSKEILLFGDSHAAQLNYFADILGKSLGVRIRVITASSCVPIEGFDKERISEWARKPCVDQIAAVKGYFDMADGILLAVMWQSHSRSEKFVRALENFLSETAKRKQPLVVLAQIPMLTSNVQRIQRFNELGGSRTADLEKTWTGANQQIKKQVLNYPNVAFFDPTSLPLFAAPPFADGVLIYHDNHHLNEVGSKAYGAAAAHPLGKIFAQLQSGRPRKLSATPDLSGKVRPNEISRTQH
jgi:peptidoglycan/LPS O-acetylase OafA/YrhL